MKKLSVKSFALASGITWGILVFVLTWWLIIIEGPGHGDMLLERMYIGYSITPGGSLMGLLWGFFDGAIIGALFAWLYNVLGSAEASNIQET